LIRLLFRSLGVELLPFLSNASVFIFEEGHVAIQLAFVKVLVSRFRDALEDVSCDVDRYSKLLAFISPDISWVWGIRAEALSNMSQADLIEELRWLSMLQRLHVKAGDAWSHRRLLLTKLKIQPGLVTAELAFIVEQASRHPHHYYAMNHFNWLAPHVPDSKPFFLEILTVAPLHYGVYHHLLRGNLEKETRPDLEIVASVARCYRDSESFCQFIYLADLEISTFCEQGKWSTYFQQLEYYYRVFLGRMAHLFVDLEAHYYWDKKSGQTRDEWVATMKGSRTVYVGNLSFYTTEEQVIELFSKCGAVSRVIMGLNRVKKTPCGFCFVEFESHRGAGFAVNVISGAALDDRTLRVDWDGGFVEGRQFGRGQTGDQWRDDLRDDFDPARGGQGRALLKSLEDGSQIFVGSRDGGDRRGGFRGGRGGGFKRPYGEDGDQGDYKRQRQ